ncbi:hypothetical protein TZ02_01060 [Clostridium aceticum]|nr:hypothetical protein TZ02_01060 [Clostridium aceticum]
MKKDTISKLIYFMTSVVIIVSIGASRFQSYILTIIAILSFILLIIFSFKQILLINDTKEKKIRCLMLATIATITTISIIRIWI